MGWKASPNPHKVLATPKANSESRNAAASNLKRSMLLTHSFVAKMYAFTKTMNAWNSQIPQDTNRIILVRSMVWRKVTNRRKRKSKRGIASYRLEIVDLSLYYNPLLARNSDRISATLSPAATAKLDSRQS